MENNYQLNLNNLFINRTNSYRNSEIVYKNIVKYSYSELQKRVRRLASSLISLGVNKGDIIAIADWNSHRYLAQRIYFIFKPRGHYGSFQKMQLGFSSHYY